jgi:hypothetical protein
LEASFSGMDVAAARVLISFMGARRSLGAGWQLQSLEYSSFVINRF